MKIGTVMMTAGVLALGLASWTPSKAQGPLYDRVNVNLPYSVTIGERTLPPGDYVIQQLRDQGGGSRVLLIYSDNGMKFETSAMTIPALQGTSVTQDNTRVVLHHFGSDYYFDKVWIQGKDYGYEFPLPDAVKSRQRERLEPISVAANYSSVQSTDSANTTASAATTQKTTTPAAANSTTTTAATNKQTTTSQAATTPATTAATSGQTTLGRAAEQQATSTPSTTTRTMTAQNQSTMQPATTPSTSRSTMTPSTTMATSTAAQHGSTDSGSADRSMPNTSAGWLMMLLSGGALSGAGLTLRRKR
jgi:hypothetical protein